MRSTAARAAVAVASLATALAVACPARGDDPRPRVPRTPVEYLAERGAHIIEDLSDHDLLATIKLDASATWKKRLAGLAREEAGRRGLTNDAFPQPYAGPKRARAPITANEAELEILARIVNGESWTRMPYDGRVAIASVVLNRVVGKGWPKTIEAVAHQPFQFSSYNPSVRAELYDAEIPQSCWQAAKDALEGQDPVNGATFYFNPYVCRPSWADDMKFVKRIGDSPLTTHDFYRP